MQTQSPSGAPFSSFGGAQLWLGPNDSSIHRGDRSNTGDEEARPTEKGSGDAQSTFDPTAVYNPEDELSELDGMEIVQANDGRLGLTDIGDVPADDWAADTGPTRSNEEL